MSEMIERAAKAIKDELSGSIESLDNELLYAVTRAAIEAMREPTQEIRTEIYRQTPIKLTHDLGDVWRALIDAALSDKPK